MRVLLSIRPEHVANIVDGQKTYEFRRRLFSRPDVTTILIYETKPTGRLIGEFDIAEILEDDPEALWRVTERGSGISKGYFDAYFEGRSRAFALAIGELRLFDDPIDPQDVIHGFTPPQSFMYVGGKGEDIHRVREPALL